MAGKQRCSLNAVRAFGLCAVVLAAVALLPGIASAQLLNADQADPNLKGVDASGALGELLPLDATFVNADGETVRLRDYFTDDKPVIITFGYYRCPVICPVTLGALARTLNECDYTLGDDFRVVTISFDHTEGTTASMNARLTYGGMYTKADVVSGDARGAWSFHTSTEGNIRALTDAVGYEFRLLANGEYAHPAVMVVCSADGRVMRYLYGLEHDPRQVKLSLLEASEGRIAASIGDRILQYCYRFDPNAGEYSMAAMNVMRLAGGVTVVGLVVGIGLLFLGERTRKSFRHARGNNAEHQSSTSTPIPALGGAGQG